VTYAEPETASWRSRWGSTAVGAARSAKATFSRWALGTLHLFQVPIGAAQAGQDYEVIVDRRRR
jgi:hypothetical protein